MSREQDPVNELYDCGSDLVEAASAVRRRASHPGTGDAAPALLGCIEAALRDLADTAASFAALPDEAWGHGGDAHAAGRRLRQRERMRKGLANLQFALGDAASSAGAARSLTARVISDEQRDRG